MHIDSQVKVADVMTREVITVAPGTPFKSIVQEITDHRVSALPVIDLDGGVVGVVSEADLLLKESHPDGEPHRILEPARRKAERAKSRGLTAADLMSAPAVTILPTAAVAEAARLMHKRQLKRLVVVDKAGRLAGIITRGDALRVFLRPDAEIKRVVVEDLVARELWLEADGLEVSVADGVVTLSGKLDRRSDVEVLSRLTVELDGVVGVVNRLSYAWDDRKPPVTPAPVNPFWPARALRD
jgi:CBS domain-containing protein